MKRSFSAMLVVGLATITFGLERSCSQPGVESDGLNMVLTGPRDR